MRQAMMTVGERDIPRSQWINIAPEVVGLDSDSESIGKADDDFKAGVAIWPIKSQISVIWRRSWVDESEH
jgi:hypothetical protein